MQRDASGAILPPFWTRVVEAPNRHRPRWFDLYFGMQSHIERIEYLDSSCERDAKILISPFLLGLALQSGIHIECAPSKRLSRKASMRRTRARQRRSNPSLVGLERSD